MTLPDHYEPETVEKHVKQYWEETDAYEAAKQANSDGDPFYFVDGPPFTSGRMHCGTAWGKVLKDALLRYHRMQGRNVVARPGYDTHGLPVERRVEGNHDFDTKQEVEEFGVDNFVAECREYVEEQREVMDEEFADLGVWMDWDDPYQTMDREYMETVWAAFQQLHEQGLVTRDNRIVNTCPDCETPVAETRLSYEEREAVEAFVGFPVDSEPNTWLLTWTTTPWTVTGNQFVAVDADATYALVDADGTRLYVAANTVDTVMDSLGYEAYDVVNTLSGEELVGVKYTNPLAEHLPDEAPSAEGRVAHAEYVDVEGDGTGLVHSAPGYGEEDFKRGRELGYSAYAPVDDTGTFTDGAGAYAGVRVRDAVDDVLTDLEQAGALFETHPHTHEYPRCPRCDTQILYRAADQWVVQVTDFKDELLDAVDDTEWYPADARENRFRKMVEKAPDWNVSRQRYWGTPVPVWTCADCETDVVVGSPEELADLGNLDTPPGDLHRPSVDPVELTCPECGGDAHRTEDVLDVWFDSAVASWATSGVMPPDAPDHWPADLVVEGHDQTRGWFLMQLYLGVALEGRAPYEEVLMHGFAQLDGEAMSKSRGHVLRPPTVIDEYGRDPLRARLLTHNPQDNDVNLSSDLDGVATLQQKLDVVWNVFRFALMYMELDDHEPEPQLATADSQREMLDNWVLSRLQSVVAESKAAMENRRTDRAFHTVLEYVTEDVSRYYVQAVRDRVWEGSETVYDVLATVMHAVCRLLAPFTPHLAERLYTALSGEQSTVHATDWPTVDASLRNPGLETDVDHLRQVEEAVAAARHEHGRKQRWPVANVVVETDSEEVLDAVDAHTEVLAEHLNAKDVAARHEYGQLTAEPVPLMEELGPEFGALAPDVADAVERESVTDLPAELAVGNQSVTVTEEMVDVEEKPPETVVAEEFDHGSVYVDMELTSELKREGVYRDVLRRAQELRDDVGVSMTERVALDVSTSHSLVQEAVSEYEEDLCSEARAASLTAVDDPDASTEWVMDGETVSVAVARLGG